MIKHLSIFATTRCNLKCLHCMIDFPKKPIDFPLDLLDRLLVDARVYGAQHVGMSGGESCLHPEFDKMVSMIVGKGYTWNAVTNGLDPEAYLKLARKFPNALNYLGVSIDGADEETHDYIRARKGAFKITTSAVREFATEKIRHGSEKLKKWT
jgi:MoaA/NifB/PqqE/SkfB family radical SAM enzyme